MTGVRRVDVAVIGGGPAGVAAAVTAAEAGAGVVLVDGAPRLGGQYYRRPPAGSEQLSRGRRRHRWRAFDGLEARLEELVAAGRLQVLPGTTVWSAEGGSPFLLRTRGGDRDPLAPVGLLRARTVVLATGAHDRQLPFPGWDLPGVMTGGAAQALVKGSGVLPGQAVVVAGTGPFLLAVAATLLRAGGRVVAVVEANTPHRLLTRPSELLPGLGRSGQLAGFAALLVRHRVRYLARHRVLRAVGGDAVGAVVVARVDGQGRVRSGTERELACDVLAVGQGFVPQTDLAVQLGCPVGTGTDGGPAVTVDDLQQAGVPGVFAAGESTGVGGAELALVEGLVAGAAAARRLGLAPAVDQDLLRRRQRRVAGLRRFADALHRTFPADPGWAQRVDDATLICRCEEVTAGRVREAVTGLGAADPRTVKLLTRAGMGWCQGRICAEAVDRLCPPPPDPAAGTARMLSAAKRPLAVPVGLGALAAMDGPGPDPGHPGAGPAGPSAGGSPGPRPLSTPDQPRRDQEGPTP
ncbi:MAG TPA: NAD(P)/FAD-dependent oxidoreductase [Kineosporiaceae bacterium]|nr:NAD(P)/FAD-dependent oxidoreductase [Kineosporiaceae bacterium]